MPLLRRCARCRTWILTIASAVVASGVARAQEPSTAAQQEAAQRLAHRAGAWEIRMEMLDPAGQTTRIVAGTDTARFVEGGKVLEIVTRFPDLREVSYAWMFLDPVDGRFKNASVDTKGNHWILQGPLDAFRLDSEDRGARPTEMVRVHFEHTELAPDRFVALGWYSTDQGRAWVPLSRQVFTRADRQDDSEDASPAQGPGPPLRD